MAEEVGLKLTLDIAKAKSDAEALAKKIEKLTKDFGENSKEVQEAQKEYDSLNKNIKELEKSQEPLSGQLEKITKQLQVLKLNGQENTKEYANLIAEAGKLKDAMQDTEKAISLVASDTSNLDAVLGAASAVTGGFGLFTAGMSLLGKDTDKVEKAQKRLMQAIALVNSVQQIANALNKDSALMVKLNAAAHKLFAKQMEATAVATRGASGAMKGFKAALVSTGIGALVVALGFAVSKLIDFIEKQKEATAAAEESNAKMKELANSQANTWNSYLSSVDNMKSALADSKKQLDDFGKSNKELFEDIQPEIDKVTESIKSQKIEVETWEKNLINTQTNLENAYFAMRHLDYGSKERANAELEYEKLLKNEAEALKNKEGSEKILNDLEIKRNSLLLNQKQLEKQINDERIAKAKEYLSLLQNINSAIQNNNKTLRDMMADFAKDNPEEYYKIATSNIAEDREEALKKENERYKAERKKLKKNSKEIEAEEKLHKQNMQIIHLTWMKNQQTLDDEYSKYLDAENEKRIQAEKEAQEERIQAEKEAQEKINALKEQLSATMASLTSLKGGYDNPFRVDTTEMKNEYDQWTSLFKEALETNLINKKQYDDLMADADEVYLAKQNEAMWSTVGNYINYYSTLASYATQIMDNLTSLESENSKEAFERNKKSQIASAWVNGIAGAAGAFAQSMAQYGLPYGAIIGAAGSAATLAATAAQVANIKKQQWQNGTGVGKTSSGSGSSGSSSANTKPSSVSNTIISRNIPNTVVQPKTETVLVVDDVTAKQMEQENVKRVSTI